MKVFIKGFNSCAMRKQNLEHYRRFLEENGHELVENPDACDAMVLWTCAFREDVLQNSLDEVARFQEKYAAKIVAVGCLPDIDQDRLKACFNGEIVPWKKEGKELDRIFGAPKASFENTTPIFVEQALCEDAAAYRKKHPDANVTFHDQFIKLLITEGCPFSCTYCTERLAFPAFRSFPEDELLEACRRMVQQTGHKKVMLLSDCLGEYGQDTGSNLPKLLEKLCSIDANLKFALNNLHPAHFLKFISEMRKFLSEGLICHLNLPIQSASNHVLGLMNRIYKREELENIFGMLKEVDFTAFDTHLIAGFPGETEEDFEETIQFILKHKPKYVLLSKFFEAPHAPAAQLPNKVSAETTQARIERARLAFEKIGIICNYEGSEFVQERLRRLNTQGEPCCQEK